MARKAIWSDEEKADFATIVGCTAADNRTAPAQPLWPDLSVGLWK
jgi:plasmid stabilization system protein ParE